LPTSRGGMRFCPRAKRQYFEFIWEIVPTGKNHDTIAGALALTGQPAS